MKRLFVLFVLLLVLIAGALPAAPAHADDALRKQWKSLRDAAVPRLEAHAKWCNAQKLRSERNDAYYALLLLRPDHVIARRKLKYKRGADGKWARNRTYRPPRESKDAAQVAEAKSRLRTALAPLRAAVAALRSDPKTATADRERAVDELARLLDDDEEVRTWNGEVELEGAWVLRETASALKRGPQLREALKELLSKQPAPKEVKPTADEVRLLRDFESGAENDYVRVLSMRNSLPAKQTAQQVAAAWKAFEVGIGVEPATQLRPRMFIYASTEQGIGAVASHPKADRK